MDRYQLLRCLPGVDKFLQARSINALTRTYSVRKVTKAIRLSLEALRAELLQAEDLTPYAYLTFEDERVIEKLLPKIQALLVQAETPLLRPVINATGVLLHTNLGRAPLSERTAEAVATILKAYSNLEYDLQEGSRGERYQALEPLLCELTGAEAALVVNNNAAAMLLCLNELAAGFDVLVSRGELVEIGGSFRIPDVMKKAGVTLVEVGTTNKTHLYDYENAVSEKTKVLLKVHQSNFKLVGFHEDVSCSDLVPLKEAKGLTLLYDLGSGLLHPQAKTYFPDEPSVMDALESGADLICFSGDKLLGGPQAGIILGKKELVDRLKKNPFTRAFRIDKMVVAALEASLRVYLEPETITHEIPIYQFYDTPLKQLEIETDAFIDRLIAQGIEASLVSTRGQFGGGSAPGTSFPSVAFEVKPETYGLRCLDFERRLRAEPIPVIARTQNDALLFDLRCVGEQEREVLYRSLVKILIDERA